MEYTNNIKNKINSYKIKKLFLHITCKKKKRFFEISYNSLNSKVAKTIIKNI